MSSELPSSTFFLYFLLLQLHAETSTLTGSIVLVVMYELRNGAEQVLFCQVKCGLPCFCLSDLIMDHPGILLPI